MFKWCLSFNQMNYLSIQELLFFNLTRTHLQKVFSVNVLQACFNMETLIDHLTQRLTLFSVTILLDATATVPISDGLEKEII